MLKENAAGSFLWGNLCMVLALPRRKGAVPVLQTTGVMYMRFWAANWKNVWGWHTFSAKLFLPTWVTNRAVSCWHFVVLQRSFGECRRNCHGTILSELLETPSFMICVIALSSKIASSIFKKLLLLKDAPQTMKPERLQFCAVYRTAKNQKANSFCTAPQRHVYNTETAGSILAAGQGLQNHLIILTGHIKAVTHPGVLRGSLRTRCPQSTNRLRSS